jgi:hypothetical protein
MAVHAATHTYNDYSPGHLDAEVPELNRSLEGWGDLLADLVKTVIKVNIALDSPERL